jgi:hypothetical protein
LLAACSAGPAEDPRRAEVVDFCARFLADYSARRWDAVANALAPGAVSAHALVRVSVTPLTEFLEHARTALDKDPEFHEYMSGEPTVLMEGDIATVWAPFRVRSRHGKGGGIDAFHLARVRGEWKIVALCDVFHPD